MFKYPDKPNGQFEPYGMAHDIYQAFMKKSNFRYCFFSLSFAPGLMLMFCSVVE